MFIDIPSQNPRRIRDTSDTLATHTLSVLAINAGFTDYSARSGYLQQRSFPGEVGGSEAMSRRTLR